LALDRPAQGIRQPPIDAGRMRLAIGRNLHLHLSIERGDLRLFSARYRSSRSGQ
jgi:hypothetical protein